MKGSFTVPSATSNVRFGSQNINLLELRVGPKEVLHASILEKLRTDPVQAFLWICLSIRSVPCSLSAVLKLFRKMFLALARPVVPMDGRLNFGSAMAFQPKVSRSLTPGHLYCNSISNNTVTARVLCHPPPNGHIRRHCPVQRTCPKVS